MDESFAVYLGVFFAVVFLLLALSNGRKRRLLDDTPTSKALGVFIGDVQLEAQCTLKDPVVSFLAEKPCVVFAWTIDELWQRKRTVTYTDEKGRTRKKTVTDYGYDRIAEGGVKGGFYLQDETGYVWVNPDGADLEMLQLFHQKVGPASSIYYAKGPRRRVRGSMDERVFTEYGLPVGTRLFVRGRASERKDVVAPQIKHEDEAEMFIIKPRNKAEVSAGKAMGFVAWNVAGVVSAGFSGVASLAFWPTEWVLFVQVDSAPFIAFAGGGVVYLLGLAVGWVWMVLNSLIRLRNRVRQAKSLIDVQLERRANLIPPLLACVQGLAAHESSVQALVAAFRAQAHPGPVAPVAPLLVAVNERYPELRLHESFDELRKNLVETEDRIALSRDYHASIAIFYNTRLERVPDRFIAALVGLTPETLFQAEAFERQAQKLSL
jgi:hypothetical protein